MLLNIHVPEQAKEGDPEDEEDRVPYEDEGDALREGDHVEDGGEGGEGRGDFGEDLGMLVGEGGEGGLGREYPFPIRVLVRLVRMVQVDAIQTADSEREDELEEAEDGVCDPGEGHFEAFDDSHFACCAALSLFLDEEGIVAIASLLEDLVEKDGGCADKVKEKVVWYLR